MNKEKTICTALIVLLLVFLGIRFSVAPDEMTRSSFVAETNGSIAKASQVDTAAGLGQFSVERSVGIWVAAFFTLAIFSFLYKDNPFYKISEAIFVGVLRSVLDGCCVLDNIHSQTFLENYFQADTKLGDAGLEIVHESYWWLYFIPLILGIMLLMRLSPKGSWMALWPLAFIIGTTAGMRLVAYLDADFLGQIQNAIIPPVVFTEAGAIDGMQTLNNLVVTIGLLVCLVYFFFSIEHKGTVGKIARSGIWVLMVTFGAAFGYTVMGRIALLAARFQFLLDDWLGIIPPGAV